MTEAPETKGQNSGLRPVLGVCRGPTSSRQGGSWSPSKAAGRGEDGGLRGLGEHLGPEQGPGKGPGQSGPRAPERRGRGDVPQEALTVYAGSVPGGHALSLSGDHG